MCWQRTATSTASGVNLFFFCGYITSPCLNPPSSFFPDLGYHLWFCKQGSSQRGGREERWGGGGGLGGTGSESSLGSGHRLASCRRSDRASLCVSSASAALRTGSHTLGNLTARISQQPLPPAPPPSPPHPCLASIQEPQLEVSRMPSNALHTTHRSKDLRFCST